MSLWDRLTYPFRSGPRRPLSARQPHLSAGDNKTPLGMEATDISSVSAVNRRNDALERSFGVNVTNARDRVGHVEPLPNDETYSAWYTRAFQQKGS
jgi:hypothetical protein